VRSKRIGLVWGLLVSSGFFRRQSRPPRVQDSAGMHSPGAVLPLADPHSLYGRAGHFLFAAGTASGRLASYRINQQSGALTPLDVKPYFCHRAQVVRRRERKGE
jgi:hypothetical protein